MRKKELRTASKRRRKSANHPAVKSSRNATRRRKARRAKKARQPKK
jgi:hypothetical protein